MHSNCEGNDNTLKEGRNEIDLVFQSNEVTGHQLVDFMVKMTSSYTQAHEESSDHCNNEIISLEEV